MEREKLKNILSDFGYKDETIKKILQGKMMPTLLKAISLNDKHGIPFKAWLDIPAFVKSGSKEAVETSSACCNDSATEAQHQEENNENSHQKDSA